MQLMAELGAGAEKGLSWSRVRRTLIDAEKRQLVSAEAVNPVLPPPSADSRGATASTPTEL